MMFENGLITRLIMEICMDYPRLRRGLFALSALAFVVFADPTGATFWLGLAFVGILAGFCELVAPRE